MLSRIFLSIYATVEMNTDLDPVGTAVPGEIPGEMIVLSCCSAVSESDVGGQLVLLSSLAQLQNLDSCPSVSTCKWHPVHKHLPLSSSCSFAFYLPCQYYRFKFILSQHIHCLYQILTLWDHSFWGYAPDISVKKCTSWPGDLDLWPFNPKTRIFKGHSLQQVLTLWDL